MSTRLLPVGVIVILGLLLPRLAGALPEDPGALTFQQTTRTEPIAGKQVTFDLYVPQAVGPAPVVAVGHGFPRSKANMVGWGQELARRGYVVAVPSFPFGAPDHAGNAKILAGLLAWMVTQGQSAGSLLFGRVDGERRGVVGYSAGGLSAVLAAADEPSIDVVVGLDPVDVGGAGQQAAPKLQVPVTFIRAEAHACNSNGNAAQIFAALTVPRLSLQVIGGTHCDGESPADPLCALTCGAQDAQRHARFRRYAFATLDHVLLCDGSMAAWLGGSSAQADTAIKNIEPQGYPPPMQTCGPVADGPVPDLGPGDGSAAPDAGGSDAVVGDQGSTTADGPAAGDGSAPVEDEGCSCHLARAPGGPAAELALLLGVLLVVLRRRRG
jgi:MYXO-CTERM domain-containing protein